MTPVGRGHWCNGQNGEEEENALHPGVGEHSETKNRFQEKREDAGLEDTGWVRLLEGSGERKELTGKGGGSATSTWRHTGSLKKKSLRCAGCVADAAWQLRQFCRRLHLILFTERIHLMFASFLSKNLELFQ